MELLLMVAAWLEESFGDDPALSGIVGVGVVVSACAASPLAAASLLAEQLRLALESPIQSQR